jgi:hypothetical protein
MIELKQPIASALKPTSGAALPIGSCPSNGILLESGGTIIGLAPSVAGSIPQWTGTAWVDSSRAAGIATTSTPGITLANTTAATAGVPVQYSQALQISGTAHDTDGNVSVAHHCRIGLRPVNGNTTSSAVHISFATDSGSYTSRLNLSNVGVLTTNYLALDGVSGSISIGLSGARVDGYSDRSTGLGTSTNYSCLGASYPLVLLHNARTDGENNVVIANVYDRNAASLTNGSSMMNVLNSWVNDADLNRHMAESYYDGSIWLAAGNATGAIGVHNGAGGKFGNINELVSIPNGGGAATTTAQVPAGAILFSAPILVTTAVPGSVTLSVGIASAATVFGTGISGAAGTSNKGTANEWTVAATAQGIVVTPSGDPGADTGRVRVACTYYLPSAPTS